MSKLPPGGSGEVVVTTYATVCSSPSFPQPLLTPSFTGVPVLPSAITMLPTLQYAPLATFDPGQPQQHQGLTFQTLNNSFPTNGFPLLSQASILPSSFLPTTPATPATPVRGYQQQAKPTSEELASGESSEDEDMHLCGACKEQFQSYREFSRHKKNCSARKQKNKKSKPEEFQPQNEENKLSIKTSMASSNGGTQVPNAASTLNTSLQTNSLQSTDPTMTLSNVSSSHQQPVLQTPISAMPSVGSTNPGNNPNLEANAISLLANQFGEGCPVNSEKSGGEEIVEWQVEEGELASEGGEEPLLCISVEQGAGGQQVQYQPIHSLSLPSPSAPQGGTILTSIPNIQIQECTINFSLADTGLSLEQDLVLSQQPITSPMKTQPPRKGGNEAKRTDPSGRKVHQCTFVGCLFTTKYSKDLTRHMTKHTGEKPFSCHLCGNTFGRQDKLNRHMQVHTGYKPFSCAACSYKAVDRCTLKKHMRVHTDERPYHCQICPYRSKDSSQLTVHLRTHTGDAPFACQEPDCAATFKTNSDLTRHIRTHTGEKPYKCDYCDHRVKIKSNLKAHIRVNHRPNEVFKCRLESCDFVSVSRAELRDHLKTHNNTTLAGDSLLSCTFCSFATTSRQKLTNHLKDHNTARPFRCTYCAYSAKSQAILSSHINKRHGALVASSKAKALSQGKMVKEAGRFEKKSPKGKVQGEESEMSKKDTKVVLNKSTCKPNFICPVCPAGFVRRDSLRSHVKQHQKAGVPIPSMIETYVGDASSRDNVIKVLSSSTRPHLAVQLAPVFSADHCQT